MRLGEKATATLDIGSLKGSSGSSSGEIVFDGLSSDDTAAGWSVDSTKIQVPAGIIKPLKVTFSAPDQVPQNTVARLGVKHCVELNLRGVIKGGTPSPPSPEGIRVCIKIQASLMPCHPAEIEEPVADS